MQSDLAFPLAPHIVATLILAEHAQENNAIWKGRAVK
jgi:hypothetical protein